MIRVVICDDQDVVREGLRAIIGTTEGRNIIVSPQSGMVVVRAMPQEMRSVEAFLRSDRVHDVVVALPADLVADPPAYLRNPRVFVVEGGARRQDSVANAFGKGAAPVPNGNLIMVTSAVPGEGKTFTAINLAMAIHDAQLDACTIAEMERAIGMPVIRTRRGGRSGGGGAEHPHRARRAGHHLRALRAGDAPGLPSWLRPSRLITWRSSRRP